MKISTVRGGKGSNTCEAVFLRPECSDTIETFRTVALTGCRLGVESGGLCWTKPVKKWLQHDVSEVHGLG